MGIIYIYNYNNFITDTVGGKVECCVGLHSSVRI